MAERLKAISAPASDISTYELSRNWKYGLNFYFNRELPEWAPGSDEPEWILAGFPGILDDRAFYGRYELEDEEEGIENGGPLFLFHHR